MLAPSVCVLAGIGVSEITSKMFESIKAALSEDNENKIEEEPESKEELKESKNSKGKTIKKTKQAPKNGKQV